MPAVNTTQAKHIAKTGKNAGHWVNCDATPGKCPVGGTHIANSVLVSVQAILKDNGQNKTLAQITGKDVIDFYQSRLRTPAGVTPSAPLTGAGTKPRKTTRTRIWEVQEGDIINGKIVKTNTGGRQADGRLFRIIEWEDGTTWRPDNLNDFINIQARPTQLMR